MHTCCILVMIKWDELKTPKHPSKTSIKPKSNPFGEYDFWQISYMYKGYVYLFIYFYLFIFHWKIQASTLQY